MDGTLEQKQTDNTLNYSLPPPSLPNFSDTNNSSEIVSNIAIRIPPFWLEKPQIQFAQIEAQFQSIKITRDSLKFNAIIGAIESQVLTQVSDAVLNPPSTNKYENLKTQIVERFEDSEQRKIKKTSFRS